MPGGEHQSQYIEGELPGVGVRGEFTGLDRRTDNLGKRAPQLTMPLREGVVQFAWTIVVLAGCTEEETAAGHLAAFIDPRQPEIEEGTQARESGRVLLCRGENPLAKEGLRPMQNGTLQFVLRPEVGEEPALREPRSLCDIAEGERLETNLACQREGVGEDGLAGLLALAHGCGQRFLAQRKRLVHGAYMFG